MFRGIKKLFKTAFVLIIIGALLFGYAYQIEPYRLRQNEVFLSGDLSKNAGRPFTVALFGDTHFGFHYSLTQFEKAAEKIRLAEPDLIVFTGDLVDDLNTYDGNFSEIEEALAALQAKYGKFAVHGNHDYALSGKPVYTEIMEAGGFTVLSNETVFIPELNTVLYGIDDCLIGHGDPDLLLGTNAQYFNLVLCHEPDFFDTFSSNSISLMLSGHTHGGQVRLPFGLTDRFLPPYGQTYISGLYQEAACALYVTNGLGTTKLPLRFGAVPEVAVLRITQDSASANE